LTPRSAPDLRFAFTQLANPLSQSPMRRYQRLLFDTDGMLFDSDRAEVAALSLGAC
jgi:hypothetical protein